MSTEPSSGIYVPVGSRAGPLAGAIAWLWRLGEPASQPDSAAVGMGGLDEAAELTALVRAQRLAGAVILCEDTGGSMDWIPARRTIRAHVRFPEIGVIEDRFVLFNGGEAALESNRGIHAVRARRLLAVGGGPSCWGRLSVAPVLAALAEFLGETLARPLVALPPVGVLRLDDFPGTAQLQLQGSVRGDRRQARRMRRLRSLFRATGSVLNVAVCARALDDARVVPLESVWPQAVRELRLGAQQGAVEPVCHGFLHLDPRAQARRDNFREFGRLDRTETEERLSAALEWQATRIERPETFVAPAWAYGHFALEVSRVLGLTPWLRPEAGPILDRQQLRETLIDAPPGLSRLDYGPLVALARLGLPPTVVTHGALLDARMGDLRPPRDLVPLARLALRRDLFRLPRLSGIRWAGASDYLRMLRAHSQTELRDGHLRSPEGNSPRILGR